MHIPSRKLFQSTLIEKIQGCVRTFFSFVFYVSHPKLNRIGAANYFLFIGKIFFFLKETNTNEFYKIPDISHLSLQNRKERQQLTMQIWRLCPSEDGLDKHKHEHKNIKTQCSSYMYAYALMLQPSSLLAHKLLMLKLILVLCLLLCLCLCLSLHP